MPVMRPLPLVLALCLLPCAAAYGGEAEPPSAGAADREAEMRAAAAIGRDLLATDDAVRERAVQRLIARIDQGGDLGPFLAAMARATKDWADRRERLLETWIDQVLHGSAADRARAARLIHALGPRAVERLAEEIRHAAGMQLDAPRKGTPDPETAESPQATPEGDGAEEGADEGADEGEAAVPACCVPQTYDVLDLFKRGMNHVEVRSLLQKAPDASEVKDLGRGRFLVTAHAEGHAALAAALREIRASADAHRQQARADSPPQEAAVATPTRWRVAPVVYRVPRHVLSSARAGAPQALGQQLPQARNPDETEVHAGSEPDAARWMRLLQHGPNGVPGRPAVGPEDLALGRGGRYFQGRTRTYRKGLVRDGDGWEVEEGALELGLELDIAVLPSDADHVEVSVVASHSEVAEPMPEDSIQPAPDGPTFTLDRAEWHITRTRASVRLPARGGAAFLSLGGLGTTESEQVVVILHVRPSGETPEPGK